MFVKKLRNVDWKISVAALQQQKLAILLSIQSLNIIWMMSIRNVRSASSGDAPFLNLDRSSFLTDVG